MITYVDDLLVRGGRVVLPGEPISVGEDDPGVADVQMEDNVAAVAATVQSDRYSGKFNTDAPEFIPTGHALSGRDAESE